LATAFGFFTFVVAVFKFAFFFALAGADFFSFPMPQL
jgi:hypothetical protein